MGGMERKNKGCHLDRGGGSILEHKREGEHMSRTSHDMISRYYKERRNDSNGILNPGSQTKTIASQYNIK